MSAGKGDTYRKVQKKQWDKHYDNIFNNKGGVMKSYKCDKCGVEINSWNTNTRIITDIKVIEIDICNDCKKKCEKMVSEYEKERDKKDMEFIGKLQEKIKVETIPSTS